MDAALHDLGAQGDPGGDRFALDVEQVAARIDDPFAQQKAEREVVEIGRRRQHHRVRDPVHLERDRDLLGDALLGRLGDAVAQRERGDVRRCRRRCWLDIRIAHTIILE